MLDEYQIQYEEWRKFFNMQVSTFLIGSGISSISLDMTFEIMFIVLLFLCAYTHCSGKFPRLLAKLRKIKRARKQQYLYKGILKEDFGFKASLTKFLPFTVSCVFAATVMAGVWS
jgi:hypothetical protein